MTSIISGRIVEFLEDGFTIEHSEGQRTIVKDMNVEEHGARKLGLSIGDYVEVMGGYNPKTKYFGSGVAGIYKLAADGSWREVKVSPWWKFW
jgi:hypothetical protein